MSDTERCDKCEMFQAKLEAADRRVESLVIERDALVIEHNTTEELLQQARKQADAVSSALTRLGEKVLMTIAENIVKLDGPVSRTDGLVAAARRTFNQK